ncbi:phosphotransferase family protein [Kribbella sp. GL6]|uniref:phosphotransferase family protein n=1 Tax=Kribbella sp. GL6 TaxID=3419765 RepID=UPI003D091EAD
MDEDSAYEVLRRSGVLEGRGVRSVEVRDTGAFNSDTARVRVSFRSAPDAQFVVKTPAGNAWSRAAAIDEARFYTLVATLPDHPAVVPRCLAAAGDDAPYVVLEDLSATHQHPITRAQTIQRPSTLPAPEDQLAVVDTLARLQAYWWEHPLQAAGALEFGYWSDDSEGFERYAQRRRASWRSVLDQHRSWLPSDVVDLYERTFDGLGNHWNTWLRPRMADRLTLVHGDAYFCNYLCPRPAGAGRAYLIDWQSACIDLGALDLVNLIATFWSHDQRAEYEVPLLREFHRRLTGYGVTGYSFDDLVQDYRLGLIYWLLMPVQDAYDGSARDYWWPKMQCLTSAAGDWNCAELLVTR